jgi:magnesium chelatase family protein
LHEATDLVWPWTEASSFVTTSVVKAWTFAKWENRHLFRHLIRVHSTLCKWYGARGDPNGRCRCTQEVASRYLRKLSGPLLDRIDIQIEIPALTPAELSARTAASGESSRAIAARVSAARERQLTRQGKTNRELSGREVDEVCRPDAAGEALLREAGDRFGWSARAYYRVLKVARSIADLAGTDTLTGGQVAEAVQYRRAFASG